MAPIPMLVCSYVHHSMNILKVRSKFGIIIESAEPRERIISPYLDMVQVP
jgi:glutamate synthase (ferredoxin)